ncbi:MAG: short-chain dehydrogenase [Chloroflexi bacterium]|nr:short-chain dehydrogenase [Chloroflexota bacterium]|tara:strand:- start:379 stop:1167 length:789 start_codon:yes stop_codon:yes gene_type:complete
MSSNGIGRLTGKVAVVTGAGSRGEIIGNGQATALLFAREGCKVLLVDSEEENLSRTLRKISDQGGEASFYVGDVSNELDCQKMVELAVNTYGHLNILHNNVGVGGSGTVVEVEAEQWDHVMDVNVKSMMLASKYAIPEIASSGGGTVINISSISAIRPRGLTPYTVSKGAVIALTKAMAVDHAADKVRVNCILPGPIFSSMTSVNMTEEVRELRRISSPMGIEGSPMDIANAALYLASDESRWVTGISLIVDGGVSLMSPQR